MTDSDRINGICADLATSWLRMKEAHHQRAVRLDVVFAPVLHDVHVWTEALKRQFEGVRTDLAMTPWSAHAYDLPRRTITLSIEDKAPLEIEIEALEREAAYKVAIRRERVDVRVDVHGLRELIHDRFSNYLVYREREAEMRCLSAA